MIKLPQMVWDIDCEPIGYAGIVFHFWLNPPAPAEPAEKPAEPPAEGKKGAPWDNDLQREAAQALLSVTVPGTMTDSGEPVEIEVGTAERLWRLEHNREFRREIVIWAYQTYWTGRREKLGLELKN